MATIADTGEEHGAMEKDDTLVRVKRAAICCMSGARVVLHRTGDLSCMSKYLRWDQGNVLFMVVRILDQRNGVWHFAVKGSKNCQRRRSHHLQHLLHAVLLDGDVGFPTRTAGDGALLDSETTTQRIVCGQRVARGADAQDIRKHTH